VDLRSAHRTSAGYRCGMDMMPSGRIEREAAEAFLVDRFGRDVSTVTPLSGGEWSQAFAYKLGTRDLVVRFSAFGEAFRKDEVAARHTSATLPIPAIVEIGETPAGFYAISERRFGDVLETVDEVRMRALLPSIMATLDAIRLADITATTGYGGWASHGNAPHPTWRAALIDVISDPPSHVHHGWRNRLAESPTGDGPFIEAHAQLEAIAADLPNERHLIHSDLLNRNVLVDGDRIAAVFDWGSSMYGDFLLDLAWLCFWAPWTPALRAIDVRQAAIEHFAAIGLEVPDLDRRLRACELWIGLDGQAYQASKARWEDLAWTASRTLEIVRGD
jgi:hygromycin-B 4-O-kinase